MIVADMRMGDAGVGRCRVRVEGCAGDRGPAAQLRQTVNMQPNLKRSQVDTFKRDRLGCGHERGLARIKADGRELRVQLVHLVQQLPKRRRSRLGLFELSLQLADQVGHVVQQSSDVTGRAVERCFIIPLEALAGPADHPLQTTNAAAETLGLSMDLLTAAGGQTGQLLADHVSNGQATSQGKWLRHHRILSRGIGGRWDPLAVCQEGPVTRPRSWDGNISDDDRRRRPSRG